MKAKRVMLQLLLLVTAAGFAASAAAAMYKWTDKKGNVHYTQDPPPEGDAKEIAPPPRVKAPTPNKTSGNKETSETDQDKSAAAPPALTPEQQEIKKRNCEAAKGNLEKYKTAHRIKQGDGQIVVMDDDIRQQKTQQAEEQIKRFCN